LRAFVELLPFSMTLVASHGCTLLKLLHHRTVVIMRWLDFALHLLRDVLIGTVARKVLGMARYSR
jgi:hypothetical protein